MTQHAIGTFDVQMTPVKPDETSPAVPARMLLEKQFQGELKGNSKGQMLTAMTAVEGSAGYVAIEEVTGEINGRFGTFILQHTGIMGHGEQQLSIVVVPDSATGELAGLSGTMSISINEAGNHTYELTFTLPNV